METAGSSEPFVYYTYILKNFTYSLPIGHEERAPRIREATSFFAAGYEVARCWWALPIWSLHPSVTDFLTHMGIRLFKLLCIFNYY
jgi:hypothetical protein